MKRLEHMKECLIGCVQSQISGNLDQVDAKELGEAIDMIKDLEEAIYYATITKAMHTREEEEKESRHQPMHEQRSYYSEPMRYDERMETPHHMHEGSSPKYRRMYMESKQMNQDTAKTMHDLEKYMQELSSDVMEMIEKATPEEKQILRQKITTLATKIK